MPKTQDFKKLGMNYKTAHTGQRWRQVKVKEKLDELCAPSGWRGV